MSYRTGISSILLAIFIVILPLAVWSQTNSTDESEIGKLATRTADRVAKTQAHGVLVLAVQGCLLDPSICGALDQKVRAEIQMRIPGVQLFGRGDIIPLLPKHGFLPIDGYSGVVEAMAPNLGAEIMVYESLIGIESGYEVTATVWDSSKHKNLDEFKTKVMRPASDSIAEPLIFREPADGPALLVPKMGNSPQKGLFPSCEKCPEPGYTDEARAKKIEGIVLLVITITEQGTAEHISVVRSLGGGLTDSAIAAVRAWRFRPAVGRDGKPFATRTPIEVNFRLLNR